MKSRKRHPTGNQAGCRRSAWVAMVAASTFVTFSLCLFSPFSWGQGKPLKMPIQKPSAQPVPKPAEKKEVKETPKPQTRPSPQVPELPSAPALDFALEMKKLESLLQINDKNAEAYYNRGWLYAYKGDMDRAVQDYTKAIAIDKKMKDAFYNRGILLARMKKFEDALKDFSETIKLESKATDAYCNRGSVHLQMGKPDLALTDFNSGLKLNPNDADLLYNRALVYLAKGDKNAATADLKKSAQMFHDRTRKEFPELAPQVPPELRKAGLDCRAGEFLSYMPQETKQRVQRFEDMRVRVEKVFSELEKKVKQALGDKVRRQGNTLAFHIQGTDPRWAEIFGPKWPEMIKQNPREPRFFYISMEFAWKEECQVLQRFQACLENPAYCQETSVPNAALQIKKIGGSWQLVDGKRPEEWKQADVLGSGFPEIALWLDKFLSENKGKMAHEEMLINLAKGYTQRVAALAAKVKAAK
ncbi:MAG: tetratricopeptide repeat protein [Deltaproteobacteria bacterium]|nr:tetratricopeptide repeat protein [Deltaproteobacteria bacterium]